MPRWPGPVMAVAGALVALIALGAGAAALQGAPEIAAPAALAGLAILGGILFVAGLLYIAVRQLRVRRYLAPERYRGPSILLLLLLVLMLATILTAPFADDAAALVLGEGELTFLGALVLLTATQAALLIVSWLLVYLPGALKALPRFPGPNPAAAVRAGLVWGVVAWLGSSMLALGIAWALERAGFVVEPQAAEQAIAAVEPWVVIVAIVILAPVAEEVFFRGIVFNAWLRERGRRWAFIGSAVLFAVIHVSLVALVPILLLGLALAWIYARTGNLLAPIVMHATVNGISVALALLVRFEIIGLPT